MTSVVSRPFAQRTGNFVVIANYVDGQLYSNCYLYAESDIAAWASDNASIVSVNGNIYTSSVANYETVVGNLWTSYSSFGSFPIGTELKDMGKDIYIGLPDEANLLHLRLVQLPGTVANLGKGGAVGYVVIEANADILNGDTLPGVSVARL